MNTHINTLSLSIYLSSLFKTRFLSLSIYLSSLSSHTHSLSASVSLPFLLNLSLSHTHSLFFVYECFVPKQQIANSPRISHVHTHTHSLTHSLTRSLAHSLTHPLTHPFTLSFILMQQNAAGILQFVLKAQSQFVSYAPNTGE